MIIIEYDQTLNPNILIGHCNLISWFSDFALYLNTEWVIHHEILIGQCDLISRFSDFALYLGTHLVYEHTSFTI